MSIGFKILEDKNLSVKELMSDVKKESWSCYYFKQDIENTNYSKYVLARGQFCFDSIEFNNIFGNSIKLYDRNCPNEHFLSVGVNADDNDNQISYIHKEKMLNMVCDCIYTTYTVYFENTDLTVKFSACKQ